MEELRTKQYGETDAKDYLPGAEELNAVGDESEADADSDGDDSEGWEEVDQSDVEATENDGEGDTTVGYNSHFRPIPSNGPGLILHKFSFRKMPHNRRTSYFLWRRKSRERAR